MGHWTHAICSIIIQHSVFTICTVSDCRRYLEQGGLETLLHEFEFIGKEKGQKLVIVALSDTETNSLPCQAEPHVLLLGKLP